MLLNRPIPSAISTLFVAVLVLMPLQSAIAQSAVFDNFEYKSTLQLFGNNDWGGKTEQMWYPYLWQTRKPARLAR